MFRKKLRRDQVLSFFVTHALLPMLEARHVLFDTFVQLDRRVRQAAHEDAVCCRFMGVPGVGEITALSFKAAVDDPGGEGYLRHPPAGAGRSLR